MHAGIVGMGIMGRVLAFTLQQAGWSVTLFDQSSGESNCSQAAAGLLTPFSELDRAHRLISSLGQESIQIYKSTIIKHLPDPLYFQTSGTLVLCHPRDQAEWTLFSKRLSDHEHFNHLRKTELRELEPELTRFEKAYFFREEAHIDTQSLMGSLKNYFDAKNLFYHTNTEIISLKPYSITTKTQTHHYDMVFDCRGLGAHSVFNTLRALRGELIWLYAPDVRLKRPIRFLNPRYSMYVVPRPGHVYIIGASEIEAQDYSPISVRTALELLTAVYYVHSGFAEARIIKTVTQCRPTMPNHLPRIRYTKGLLAVNGLYRHGYLLAPALAQDILCSLNDGQSIIYPEIWEYYT